MSEHLSIVQQLGVAALVLASVLWVAGLARMLRRDHAALMTDPRSLRALPRQSPPLVECVELSPHERDAFAGLVRQFSKGH
ncbi:hypothetical protein ACIQNU_20455 [Streptomyces sp. NPDC091292]|uniref:hypothetical protein n=1 Tax=Streptomyces sp. NPDC091292 TaxID=3365991 RepID=UPI00380D8482